VCSIFIDGYGTLRKFEIETTNLNMEKYNYTLRLNGCETLTLVRKAHLRVFGKRMRNTVLGSRRGETGLSGAGKLRREESNNLFSSRSIIKVMT
jgi:hypothetical protein